MVQRGRIEQVLKKRTLLPKLACLLLFSVSLLIWNIPMRQAESSWSRAANLVSQMTLPEKITFLHGYAGPYIGNIAGNSRLGIPPVWMNDGPQGFRAEPPYGGTTTAFPSAMNIAATFDVSLAHAWGDGMAIEFRIKGSNVQLGPGMNVARVPLNGRNFEYVSGEDPYLGSKLVAGAIKGIQQNGIIANAKHYINNNEEINRINVSANLDERTQMEIYMPPFESAIHAGVMSFMCAYNRVNGIFSCENKDMLMRMLKERLGFKGWVMSDWAATHSTVDSANNGLDVEMPDDLYFGEALFKAVQNGDVKEDVIDDKVTRIVSTLAQIGALDGDDVTVSGNITANATSPERNRLARTLAARSTIILKNQDNILPLNPARLSRGGIAVLGSTAHDAPIVGGLGSGFVQPAYIITPFAGIEERMKSGKGEGDGTGGRLVLGGKGGEGGEGDDGAGKKEGMRVASGPVVYRPTEPVADAVAAARAADVAIVFVASISGENVDRTNLSFPRIEDELVFAVAAAQPNTIVVTTSPGHMLLPWADRVKGIVSVFMPGQEVGHALADVLFNDVAPSARLPITIPNKENELGFSPDQYPGLPVEMPLEAHYTEKLLVGYRWYNAKRVKPLFCFGHGLTYAEFQYSNLLITHHETTNTMTVAVSVQNSGTSPTSSRRGADTPQLYLTFPAHAGEPPRQLKGFRPTQLLNPGQKEVVTFEIVERDISIWDEKAHDWKVLYDEEFTVEVGRSSCDIRLHGVFKFPRP